MSSSIYRQVLPSFWTGETGSQLRGDPYAQLLAQYLITSPHANMIGLYRCPLAYIEEDLGWGSPFEGGSKTPLQGAIDTLERVGFAYFDPLSKVFFLPEMARIQLGLEKREALKPGDNRRKNIQKLFDEIPQSFLKDRFADRYSELFGLSLPKPLASPSGPPSKPENREQEQRTGTESREQEQEQEQRTEQNLVAQAPPSLGVVVEPEPPPAPEKPPPRASGPPNQPGKTARPGVIALGKPPDGKKSRGKSGLDRSEEVLEVFDHYRSYHPRAHKKPSSKQAEWKKIKARLDEGYTVEDLKRAIDGCHASPFHQGENERGCKYESLELIVRDGSKVNQFIEALDQSNAPALSEKTKRGRRATEQWLEEMEALDAAQG